MLSIVCSLQREANKIMLIRETLTRMVEGSNDSFKMIWNGNDSYTVEFNYSGIGTTTFNFTVKEIYETLPCKVMQSLDVSDATEQYILCKFRENVLS